MQKRPLQVETRSETIRENRQLETPKGMKSTTFTNVGNVPVKINDWILYQGGQLILAADMGETCITKFSIGFFQNLTPPQPPNKVDVYTRNLVVSYTIESAKIQDL